MNTEYIQSILADDLFAYEQGELDVEQQIDLYQDLIATGLVWEMDDFYQNTALSLINQGYCGGI